MFRMMSSVFVFLLVSTQVYAECSCECVDGQVQAICENPLEIQPICFPRMCPGELPIIKPLSLPVIPPVGTRDCRQERVYDPSTHTYGWETLCG